MDFSNSSLVLMKNGQRLNLFKLQCEAHADSHCDTTLFFIHGSMGSLIQFSELMEIYKGRVNIVAYDTIGCGLSDKPTSHNEYSTNSLTAHAIEIFEKYSTHRNVLIGHSYGTAQIARLCGHLEHITPISTIIGIVLLGTVDTLPAGGCAAFSIFSLPLCLLKPMQSWMSKTYVNMAYSSSSDPFLRERALALAGKNSMHVCKAFYQQFQWASNAHWDAISRYPVLVCQGADDQVTPLDGAQSLVNLLLSLSGNKEDLSVVQGDTLRDIEEIDCIFPTESGCKIRFAIIDKAGHHPMEEQPAQVAVHMTAFLKDECGIPF